MVDLEAKVKTVILPVDARKPEAAVIAQAAGVLRRGGLVAFPTETVYGLGANAFDGEAVRRIFAAKGRPAHDPLIVHLADKESLPAVARSVPPQVETLAARFWPGPLTLILPRGERIPPEVTSGGDTVAVRVPAHPVALALIREAGVPVAAPSANRFGHVSPTSAAHVRADLDGRVDVILDGGLTPVGVESTVLSLLNPTPLILRPGGISREVLAEVLGEVAVGQQAPSGSLRLSPGTLSQHYAPRARVILYRGAESQVRAALLTAARQLHRRGERVGLLLADEDMADFADLPYGCVSLGPQADAVQVAQRLFAALRALDASGVTVILARDFGERGLGLAIRDRLTRAAAGHVIEV